MIKEKDLIISFNGISTPNFCWFDAKNELTADLLSQHLQNAFQQANISVMIMQDDFQYKTGFMKSDTCSCLVIKSTEKGDGLCSFVLAVKKNDEATTTSAICAWYGQSDSVRLKAEIDKTIEKSEKGADRTQKKMRRRAQRLDLLGMFGARIIGTIMYKLREKKKKQLINQFNQARVGEDEYYAAVANTVHNVLNTISKQYKVCN